MTINQFLESMNLRIEPRRTEWQGENDYVVVLKLWDKNLRDRDLPSRRNQQFGPTNTHRTTYRCSVTRWRSSRRSAHT